MPKVTGLAAETGLRTFTTNKNHSTQSQLAHVTYQRRRHGALSERRRNLHRLTHRHVVLVHSRDRPEFADARRVVRHVVVVGENGIGPDERRSGIDMPGPEGRRRAVHVVLGLLSRYGGGGVLAHHLLQLREDFLFALVELREGFCRGVSRFRLLLNVLIFRHLRNERKPCYCKACNDVTKYREI